MQREIYNLLADNKPLPKGTRIKTTQGGIHTGGDHELSDDLLKSANRMVNGYVPFWILSWRDLHDDLIIPENIKKLDYNRLMLKYTVIWEDRWQTGSHWHCLARKSWVECESIDALMEVYGKQARYIFEGHILTLGEEFDPERVDIIKN